MDYQSVHVVRVSVGHRRRSVDRKRAKSLADSIGEIGMLNPITVRKTGDEYTLVAGGHRLAAAKLLGWSQIPAIVVELDDVDRMLAEIDENLIRNDLNDLERSEHLAERKRLYLLKHPETKRGGAPGKAGGGKSKSAESASFAEDTSEKTGRSRRVVEEDTQIAESIPEDVREAIRETPLADSKTDLMKMARLPEARQREIVTTVDLTDKAAVRSAITHGRPAPRPEPIPEEVVHVTEVPTTVEGFARAIAMLFTETEIQRLVSLIATTEEAATTRN